MVLFPTILLHFSLNATHHLLLQYINYYCDIVIFIALLWPVQKYLPLWRKEYLLHSFSEKRNIFQGGGSTSTILCKSITHYQILKVQWRQLKNYWEMIASTWKINFEIVAYLVIKVLELFTSKSEYLGIKVSKNLALFSFCVIFWMAILPR